MRLFIAIDVGDAIAAQAAGLVETLRRRSSTLAPRAHITWVTAERMHLTVRFIGRVDDSRAAAIQQALGPAIAVAPFAIRVTGVGAFPPRGAPRVVWAGFGGGIDALAAVEREVSDRLARLGIAREDRAYSPHLTLARVKDAAGLRAASLLEGLGEADFGSTRVDAITLFESRLSSKGPTYIPLLRTPLAAG
jgi:2'-5' RNA ligase